MPIYNELLFISQAVLMALFSLVSLRLGRSGLISWITLQAVLANLLTLKQITLFGLSVTSGDIFAVGSILSFNLLQEFYGKSQARKSILISFSGMIAYLVFTQCHVLYAPSSHDLLHESYQAILAFMPRLIIASVTTFVTVQLLDTIIYGAVRRFFGAGRLLLRATLCLMISQAIDTILFTFLGLYGVVSFPWQVISLSIMVKFAVIACSVPFVSFARRVFHR